MLAYGKWHMEVPQGRELPSVRANDFPKSELTPDTDYAALAKACGGAGATVQNLGEVADAIRWALARTGEGRCAILNVLLPRP
jgi:acetolactate synthase I/II/III large subunit